MTRLLWRRGVPAPAGTGREAEVWEQATEFLSRFYADHPQAGSLPGRLRQVRSAIRRTGTYQHTGDELGYAAKTAWRHAARCTGRDKYRTLRVRDRRGISRPDQVAAETIAHLREATNGGRIRSYATVFAPDEPGTCGPRILSAQAVRYAGYESGGAIFGDPDNTELTRLACALGWESPGGRFDILPLVVLSTSGAVSLHEIPADAVLEVPITHPEFAWFAELGLRWYATPVITSMYLEAGGVRYPCVPFSGWYQAPTEVGVRNFGDVKRYNMLPAVAARMGLDTSSNRTLWKDRALVELAVAVQHSYAQAGVMSTDHHTETARLARFVAAEEDAGRVCPVDWSWVVPPISGSATPVFHRTYTGRQLSPSYGHHEDVAQLVEHVVANVSVAGSSPVVLSH